MYIDMILLRAATAFASLERQSCRMCTFCGFFQSLHPPPPRPPQLSRQPHFPFLLFSSSNLGRPRSAIAPISNCTCGCFVYILFCKFHNIAVRVSLPEWKMQLVYFVSHRVRCSKSREQSLKQRSEEKWMHRTAWSSSTTWKISSLSHIVIDIINMGVENAVKLEIKTSRHFHTRASCRLIGTYFTYYFAKTRILILVRFRKFSLLQNDFV